MAKGKMRSPSATIAGRMAQCRRQMRKHRIAAYLITKQMDSFYLTGFTGEDSAMLVMPSAVHAISDGRFNEALNQECPWVRKWMRKGTLNAEIALVCKQLKIRSLAVQHDHLSVADHGEIKKLNKSTRLIKAPPILANMRRIKDDSELALIRKSLRVAEDAFLAMRRTIRIGQTELEMAAQLEYEMKKRGASAPSFATICAEGPNAALPHAHPGGRKVKSGSAILFDWGARVGMYCSDLTRMVFIDSMDSRMGEVYRVALEGQARAIAAIRPGEKMRDVDAVARDFITRAGYGKAFNHGLGHGLGLDVHEPPSLSWRSSEKLAAGMVVTVEPGIYLPGIGGVRIEDDVLVTATGHRVLSRLSRAPEDAILRLRR